MNPTNFASFDPVFLIFHAMVDFQWAIFEALERHRNVSYEDDCHKSFHTELPPYYMDLNSNNATKSHPRGVDTVNYTQTFGYEYDNLTLFGMAIPELDKFLEERNNHPRLFAGFSLPNMHIREIKFNICYPSNNCSFSSPNFIISKLSGNPTEEAGTSKDSILIYHEVTNNLPCFGLSADQNISFKIISTSIPANVTFTPVSIFRKAGTNEERITVHWWEDDKEYKYAPSFQIRWAAQLR